MKKGFTLAEILIVLAVIGVVAALTLPNIITHYQKKAFTARFQRAVSLITGAATKLMDDEDVSSLSDTYLLALNKDYVNAQGKFLRDYFKIDQDCGIGNYSSCLGESYVSEDGAEPKSIGELFDLERLYCVMLNIGATVCMTNMSNNSVDEDGNLNYGNAMVLVDASGPSKPNVFGQDLFQFSLNSDIMVKDYIASADTPESSDSSDSSNTPDTPTVSNDTGSKPPLFSDTAQKIGDYWVDVKGGNFPSAINCSNTSSEDYKYCGGITTSDSTWGYQAAANKACAQQGGRVPSMAELAEIYTQSNGSLMDNYRDGYKQWGITQSSEGKWYTNSSTGKQYYNAHCYGMSNGWEWGGGCAHTLMCVQ